MKRLVFLLIMFVCVTCFMHSQTQVTTPPPTLTQWLAGKESPLDSWYQKYVSANGLPVLSSAAVSDTALLQARFIANHMLSRIPEAREEMIRCHFRIGVVGYKENITDLPECKMMKVWWPDTDWDQRGRGYGATLQLPVMSIGEENLVKIPNFQERYWDESIMVHEFAHNIDFAMRRISTAFRDSLLTAYNNAKTKGLWRGTYSMNNSEEYFAEGTQAWFNTCRMVVPRSNGSTFKLTTRDQLRDYDPQLYRLCASIFPEEHLHGYHFEFNTPPSALNTVTFDNTSPLTVYALTGQHVASPYSTHISIINGKKILMK
ncbi:MAG: hypothetical protein J5770_05680 [Bacteroidaceae bacterium]|nr:hypothetical protein [Bacteroidaceae bacterium]